METLKYKLTNETIKVDGKILYRIEALKDFGPIRKGDRGGFVGGEHNLSQAGDCWIYDDAKVYDMGFVLGNSKVYGDSVIDMTAKIEGNSVIINSTISWRTKVTNSKINKSIISCKWIASSTLENVTITGVANVNDSTIISPTEVEYEDMEIYGNAIICGSDYNQVRIELDSKGVMVKYSMQ